VTAKFTGLPSVPYDNNDIGQLLTPAAVYNQSEVSTRYFSIPLALHVTTEKTGVAEARISSSTPTAKTGRSTSVTMMMMTMTHGPTLS